MYILIAEIDVEKFGILLKPFYTFIELVPDPTLSSRLSTLTHDVPKAPKRPRKKWALQEDLGALANIAQSKRQPIGF